MQSRVRRRRRFATPSCFGRIAALAVADQHEPGCSACLGRQLQPTACGQRQHLLRLGNDQRDRRGAQRLLHAPQQVGFALGGQQQQPFGQPRRKAARHRALGFMRRQDPQHRPGVAQRLKQGKAAAARSFGLVHTAPGQGKGVCGGGAPGQIAQDRHAQPPVRRRLPRKGRGGGLVRPSTPPPALAIASKVRRIAPWCLVGE